MEKLVYFIWAFWIIVIIGVIISIVMAYWWITIPIIAIALIITLAFYMHKKGGSNSVKNTCDSFLADNNEILTQLSSEYYEAVKRFIESCPKFHFTLHNATFRAGFELFNKNDFCLYFLEKDGLPTLIRTPILSSEKEIQSNFTFFINQLKQRISTQWTGDDEMLDAVVYLVFRNNLITYFYHQYIDMYNCETIEELCSKFGIGNVDSSLYTYYHLYTTDINAPIIPAYKSVCSLVCTTFDNIKRKELEKAYFDTDNQ